MRSALLPSCLAALLACACGRPSTSVFLFPGEEVSEAALLGHGGGASAPAASTVASAPVPAEASERAGSSRGATLGSAQRYRSAGGPSGDLTRRRVPAEAFSARLTDGGVAHDAREAPAGGSREAGMAAGASSGPGASAELRGAGLSAPEPTAGSAFSASGAARLNTAYSARPEGAPNGGRLQEDGETDAAAALARLAHQSAAPGQPIAGDATPSEHTASANHVMFPDWHGAGAWDRAAPSLPTCDGESVSAVHPDTGRCQVLGSAADCPEGQMLLMGGDGQAGCRPLPCPDEQLLVDGDCRPADAPLACPAGMSLTMDEYGGGVCACRPGFVRWPADGRCYAALRQGPCGVGRYVATAADGVAHCVENMCVRDGSLPWLAPGAAGCYPLQEPDAGCEAEQLLWLDAAAGQLVCDKLMMRGIFDLPSVRCGSDALQDYRGRCRSTLLQGFRGHR